MVQFVFFFSFFLLLQFCDAASSVAVVLLEGPRHGKWFHNFLSILSTMQVNQVTTLCS